MKKLIALLLAIVMVIGMFAGCKKKADKEDRSDTQSAAQPETNEDNRPYAEPLEIDGLTTSYVKGTLFYRYGATYDPTSRTLTRYHNTTSTLVKTETQYDQKGYVVCTTCYYSNGTSDKSECEYDLNTGNKICTSSYNTDGSLRQKTRYEYDTAGNKVCQAIYDADGKLTEKTTYEYDTHGNKIREVEYDASNNPAKESKYKHYTAGNTIYIAYYDAEGTLTDEVKFDYKYDAAGNKILETRYDGNSKTWEFEYEYDAAGNEIRKTSYTDNGEISYEYRYNANGKEIYYINYDENRNPTQERITEFNEHNDLIRSAKYKDGKLDTEQIYEHQYDAAGNLIIRTQFNSAGELTYEETYEYGTDGKLAKCIRYRVSANGKTVTEDCLYTYDEEGNLICEIIRNAKGEETQTFKYEPARTIVWGP